MAENYIDIFDSTSAPEIELVELTLRRHGIKYRVQSKTVIESTNMLVTGGIGARLQVEAASYERALQVLEAAGLNVGAVPVEPYPWIEKFAGMTNGFPILNRFPVAIRLIICIGLFASLFLFVTLLFIRETAAELVTKHSWCVDKIIHNGVEQWPYSTGIRIIMGSNCTETVSFGKRGRVSLPGLQTLPVNGHWEPVDSKHIKISKLDGLADMYAGTYRVREGWNSRVRLVSDQTEIVLHALSFY